MEEKTQSEKSFRLKYDELFYNLILSFDSKSVKFLINPESSKNKESYEAIYTFNDFVNKNKIFYSFESIEEIRKSIEQLLENNKYSIKENSDNIQLILNANLFDNLINIPLILYKKGLVIKKKKKKKEKKNENKENIYLNTENYLLDNEDNNGPNDSLQKLQSEINLLRLENKKLTDSNQKLFKLYDDFNKKIGQTPQIFKFKFKPGINYIVSDNGLVALKADGGYNWNCYILGDTIIPKNAVSKWRIKLKHFEIKKNIWNIMIGIGPDNLNNEELFYKSCWSFICGNSKINIRNLLNKKYMRKERKIKKGDIIEVIVDRIFGNLSFAVNGVNYGIACKIPLENDLYPVIAMYDIDQIVELVY